MTRTELGDLIGEALVVLPIGAVEQHGPHLPTGTDALIIEAVAQRAADLAATVAARTLIVAPVLTVGASDHHLSFGGTLSLSTATMHAVLADLLRSVAHAGGRRLAILNGHGGNRGPYATAAADAVTRFPLTIATADYWELAKAPDLDPLVVPGHAGRFETTMVMALRGDLVREPPVRHAPPPLPSLPYTTVHDAQLWTRIDGFTDEPATAGHEPAEALLEAFVQGSADWLTALAKEL
ncbi:MAG: creatininase family protein [Dehalococcoidia bacterium]